MAAHRRVYDSRHLQADCQNRDQLRNPTLGNEYELEGGSGGLEFLVTPLLAIN